MLKKKLGHSLSGLRSCEKLKGADLGSLTGLTVPMVSVDVVVK